MKYRIFVILILCLSGALGGLISFYTHQSKVEVPMIHTFHRPVSFVKQLEGDKHAGKRIFHEFCSSCHGKHPIIHVGAPRIGDKAAWKSYLHFGMDGLLKITITGIGAMPARGGCFECSDEQLEEAIRYMIGSNTFPSTHSTISHTSPVAASSENVPLK